MTIPYIRAAMRAGLDTCTTLTQLECQIEFLKETETQLKKQMTSFDADELMMRQRRAAIYQDVLKESALSGDRLFLFARQLSGSTAETVEDVALIDDASLNQQSKDLNERKRRAAQTAVSPLPLGPALRRGA